MQSFYSTLQSRHRRHRALLLLVMFVVNFSVNTLCAAHDALHVQEAITHQMDPTHADGDDHNHCAAHMGAHGALIPNNTLMHTALHLDSALSLQLVSHCIRHRNTEGPERPPRLS
jgi:hypothetical protein